jgi:DNA-binding ferritin-like protein (Dps family)
VVILIKFSQIKIEKFLISLLKKMIRRKTLLLPTLNTDTAEILYNSFKNNMIEICESNIFSNTYQVLNSFTSMKKQLENLYGRDKELYIKELNKYKVIFYYSFPKIKQIVENRNDKDLFTIYNILDNVINLYENDKLTNYFDCCSFLEIPHNNP